MPRISKAVYLKTSDTDQTPHEVQILNNLKYDDDLFISVKGFNNNSAQAAVIEHQNYICLAFRGTNEIEDWIDNINAFSVKELFGEFHRGFFESVDDVWKGMKHTLAELQREKRRPLFITGHSLGGAMATVAASKLIHEDKPFTSVYTFGQPRAVTRDTSRLFNMECKDRYFRFHNNNDIVTRVPARMMGYSHVGTYLYITEEGEIHKDVGRWFRFVDYIDGAFEAVKDRKFLDLIEDHDMADYLAHVDKFDLK